MKPISKHDLSFNESMPLVVNCDTPIRFEKAMAVVMKMVKLDMAEIDRAANA
jgi:hypothetical protein